MYFGFVCPFLLCSRLVCAIVAYALFFYGSPIIFHVLGGVLRVSPRGGAGGCETARSPNANFLTMIERLT
jgi:hypothetical protein